MDAFITRVKNTAHDANVPSCPQKGWAKETFAEHEKINERGGSVGERNTKNENNNYRNDPDGHPDAGEEGVPEHHGQGHYHSENAKSEKIVIPYPKKR